MPDPTQPQLGYGTPTEATIDQVNIWMRSTPWYQQQMKAWGQDPGHPTLSKSQSQQILQQAQANGVVVDQGGMEVDDHGNFNPKGHKLRNTLIVIGIAAATIGTMGAAGVFAGAGGTGMAAGGAGAGASGLGGAGAAGLGYGTVGLGAGGLGGAAAAGGGALVGGGAAAGIGAAGAGTAAALGGPSGLGAGGAAVGGGTAASGGGAGLLASSATVPGATAALPTGLASGSSAGALTGGGSSSTMGGLGRSIFNYATGGGGGGTTGLANAAIPVAGNLISGYLQSRAAGQASDAQQKYLEEALAYQKEQDAFNRTRQTGLDAQDQARWVANQTRQTGLDAQDVARYGYTTAQDAAKYGDTQQEYLANFARDENRYGYKTDLEASRYGDYSKRIAPYLASGASANDRMASLLGLPKGAAFDPRLTAGPTRQVSAPPTLSDPGTGFGGWSGSSGSGAPVSRTGQAFDPEYVGKMVDDVYAKYGLSATGPGTGPTDKAYMVNAILKNKGWEPYWEQRIPDELRKAGLVH